LLRTALPILVCLASLLLVSKLIDAGLRSRGEMVDAKYDVFVESKDEIDVLFFGSSRVYRGIMPAVFDREATRLGYPVRSFNLGMRGMPPHETNELLRRILETKPARLRWIFVELADWVSPTRENQFTQRTVGWHDTSETVSALRTSWLQDAELEPKLTDMRTHLMQYGASLIALGVADEAVRNWYGGALKSGPDRSSLWEELYRSEQGFARFTPEERTLGRMGRRHSDFIQNRDEYLTYIPRIPQLNAEDASTEHYNLVALRDQIESIEAAGIQVIYMILPSYEAVPVMHRLADRGDVPQLAAFDDPRSYPELYRVERRFDERHLELPAARRLSTLLATKFAALFPEDH